MIPNQWYAIYRSRDLRRRPVGVTRLGERLVLWRDASGRALAMRDRCPHRGAALSAGRIRDGQLECPYHGFRFDSQGQCVRMPCEGRTARIPSGMEVSVRTLREAHGLVWLFWGDADERPEIPWFDEMPAGRKGDVDYAFDWPIHYARTIESNFDIHHTPFVHGLFTPGIGTRLDPYVVETVGDTIRTRGELRHEERSSGLPFRVDFKMPGVTFLGLTPKLSALIADCPIDEANTWRYALYHQDYVGLPGLRTLASWLFLQADFRLFQLPQDLRVMRTQEPKEPAAPGHPDHDRFVRADGGSAAYQKLRRQRLGEARRHAA